MPIPKEILAVPRPKNTVVHAYGKNKDHYSVVSRVGCKYQDGRRVPINGITVGHIIDLTFIPNILNGDTEYKYLFNILDHFNKYLIS